MKKLLLLAIFLLGAGMAQAQLQVNSTGVTNTKLLVASGDTITGVGTQYALKGNLSLANKKNNIAVYGYTSIGAYNPQITKTAIGVKGEAEYAEGLNFGVYGKVLQPISGSGYLNYGAAIYGTTKSTTSFLSGNYAGYFDGPVTVTGILRANGGIYGTLYGASAPNSTMLEEQQTERYADYYSNLLSGLRLASFYYSLPVKSELVDMADSDLRYNPIIDNDKIHIYSNKHYGLSAEQLEEVFPDLVYENEDGTKSINYVEMVPILVQAINELSAKVTALEGNNSAARKIATNVDGVGEGVQVLSLGQNRPNPFGTTTDIEVSVPENVQSAFVYVYDLQGKEVQQVDITGRGKQTVQLNAAELADGMYLYSLIADGQVAETRRMIIKK